MNDRRLDQDCGEPRIEGIDQLSRHVRGQLTGLVGHFRLVLRGDGLALHGQAATYYAKQIAQHRVMEATRLAIIANDIGVS